MGPCLCGNVRNGKLFLSRGATAPCDAVYFSSGGSGIPSHFLVGFRLNFKQLKKRDGSYS